MTSQRRAKILCTIGPSTSSTEQIGKLIDAGMNAARLNLSHGSHDDHSRSFSRIREQATKRDVAIAIVADLQGPKIRVGQIPDPGLELQTGDTFVLNCDQGAQTGPGEVLIDYPPLANEASPGDRILMDDGALEAVIESIEDHRVITRIVTGGVLTSRKGVNLPATKLSLPSLTEKDKKDLRFALDLGVDAVALSFVRRVEDLNETRALMDEHGRRVPLIAKIEKPEAIENLGAIVDSADGVMVARGDLGVELGPEDVPVIQKQIIQTCNLSGKLVITATQMLDSMIRNPRPTRAEASDVANAILDGSDTVMLSGETATGKYPLRAVTTMDRIVVRTEQAEKYWRDTPPNVDLGHTTNAIARAAVSSSQILTDTQAIVVYTGSGGIARLVSEYRPKVPIYAFTPNPSTFQSLSLYWGVTPIMFQPSTPDGEQIYTDLDHAILRRNLLRNGDTVVIALGWPIKAHTSVNMLKIHRVGETLRSPD